MRVPLASQIDSRDGEANKDGRLTNVLKETDEGGDLACVRPGLELMASMSGNGSGVVAFNGILISVFGTTLGYGDDPVSIDTIIDGTYDFAQSPL